MNNQEWEKEADNINSGLKKLETEVAQQNSGVNVGDTETVLDIYLSRIESLESKGADPATIQDLKQIVETVRTKLKESRVFGGRSKRSRRQRSKRRKSRRRSSKRP